MTKTKLFIASLKPGEQEIYLIGSFYKRPELGATLFTSKVAADYSYSSFTFVQIITEADYILIPHAVRSIDINTQKYLDEIRVLAKKYDKKVLVFIGGDMSHDVFIDDMIVMKGSQYKYMMRDNEIIVPPYAEDLLESDEIEIRKKDAKPIIGFCGWAGVSTREQLLKYHVKNILINLKKIIYPFSYQEVHKKGLFFRRKAIRVLNNSKLVKTNFIIRKSFSASAKTISLDPVVARKEYRENIINSDFVLTPKGDANFSVRFYEVLTLGRIPILIDTETVLPLENFIDYSKFILRIKHKDIRKLPELISRFYANLTPDQFADMQKKAREAYEQYFRYDAFFNFAFSGPLERLLPEAIDK